MNIIEKDYKWAKPLGKRGSTDLLILHHSGTTTCTPDGVHSAHISNGWAGIGYHYLVRKDGTIYRGRPENTVGAHACGANSHSIGVCFEGNYQVDSMPSAQLVAGQKLVSDIKQRWGIAKVIGHKDVAGSTTDCPGLNFPFAAIVSRTPETPTTNTTKEEKIMVETIMIGNGDRGNAVRSMQGALIAQGYNCGSYGADGICGAATVAAIKACQAAHGLKADGICGPDTWGALLAK